MKPATPASGREIPGPRRAQVKAAASLPRVQYATEDCGCGIRPPSLNLEELVEVLRKQAQVLTAWANALERELAGLPRVSTRSKAYAFAATAVFRREGEYWTLAYKGKVVRLKHRLGLGYLRALLEASGREIPALELIGGMAEANVAAPGCHRRARTWQGLERLKEMRAMLAALDDELEQTLGNQDVGRATALREQRQLVLRALAEVSGRWVTPAECARAAVSKAVRRALAAIRRVHPELAAHLQ
ncbi:MAG: hypothetical protein N3C12_14585 [Candidatus Binatia bacterium]|nr:hypothetical protein [Candidatus Binatia bacterium]